MFNRNYQELERDLIERPSSFWLERGEEMALNLFLKASREIPAYKDFLQKGKVQIDKINTIKDFYSQVPVTDKESYIAKYSLEDRSWQTKERGGAVIYSSSGTTGLPTFWKRNTINDKESSLFHRLILEKYFQIKNKKTLFVDCFALGIHIAGYITATSINSILYDYPTVSLVTPGSKKEDILSVLHRLGNDFEQIILMGYPPFVMDVVAESIQKGFSWDKIQAGFMFAAQGFSENWRKHLMSMVGKNSNPRVINIYGSADIGAMGFETPLTIELRNQYQTLGKQYDFGLKHLNFDTPYIFQYFADLRFFETLNNEIIFTADSGAPLVRYNIHDMGGILSFDEVPPLIKEVDKEFVLKLPLVYIYGRSNHSVVFYGANIYPENIQTSLEQEDIMPHVTGKYFIEVKEDQQFKPFLNIHIELKDMVDAGIKKHIEESVLKKLQSINREFLVVYKEMGNQDRVVVVLHEKNDKDFVSRSPKKNIEK